MASIDNYVKGVKKQLDVIRKLENVLPEKSRRKQSIKKVKKGAYITVRGNFYSVSDKHTYAEGNDEWYELALYNLVTGENEFLEWEEDDELDISIVVEKLKLKDIGLSPSKLEKIDEDEEGGFKYNNTKFSYDDSDKARFYKSSDGMGEEFYYWNFEDEEEELVISVEKWSNGSYDVSLSEYLEQSEIEVISSP